MTIAIVGAGAVGCWMGGELSAAGADVTLVARGEALGALHTRGIRADDVDIPVGVAEHASEVDADVIVLAVKATGASLAEIIDGTTAPIVMTQNSVEAPRLIASVVGEDRTVPGVVRGYFHHVGPAEVTTHGGPGSFTMGPGAPALAQALEATGITGIVREDVLVDVWEKAMFVEPCGVLGLLASTDLGGLRTTYRDSLIDLITEVRNAGIGAGVPIPEDAVDRTIAFADAMPGTSTTSMQRDRMAGISGEFDAQVGAIVREGDRNGVPVPLHRLAYSLISGRQEH